MIRTKPSPKLPPDELFEDWLTLRGAGSYEALSREAAIPYRYIWKRYCDWLEEQPGKREAPRYLGASPQDIASFLTNGSSPSSNRKSPTAPVSPVTRQRYGRVLRDIYLHAERHLNLIATGRNPVTDEAIGAAPSEVERGGQILPPKVFEALYTVFSAVCSRYETRDKAIILLLLECALTSGEIRSLKMSDVRKDKSHAGQFILEIKGARLAQDRTLTTTGPAGYALHQWLVYRQVMHRSTDVIFVSEQKRGDMTRRALFSVVAKMIARACDKAQVDLPNHIGPVVIRNNAIVRWYNSGMPMGELCIRAGFKNERSFKRGLQVHLNELMSIPEAVPSTTT